MNKYLLFYPDGNIVQQSRLTRADTENCFVCDTYIFKFDKGKFYTLVDEGEASDKLIWEVVKIERLTQKTGNKK